MNEKEYGGYLPLVTVGKDFFQEGTQEHSVLRLNAARYAIIRAIFEGGGIEDMDTGISVLFSL